MSYIFNLSTKKCIFSLYKAYDENCTFTYIPTHNMYAYKYFLNLLFVLLVTSSRIVHEFFNNKKKFAEKYRWRAYVGKWTKSTIVTNHHSKTNWSPLDKLKLNYQRVVVDVELGEDKPVKQVCILGEVVFYFILDKQASNKSSLTREDHNNNNKSNSCSQKNLVLPYPSQIYYTYFIS